MKKILLTAAAVSVLATSSAYAAEDTVFLKANVGWAKLNKIKLDGNKFKSNNVVHVGIGAGYNVMDNVRVDLTFDHYVNPTHKFSTIVANGSKFVGKVKSTANSLLLNGFVDVFDYSGVKFFVGAGVGASQLSGKLTVARDGVTLDTYKSKSKYSLAYAGYVGVGYEFSEGVTGELSYSYRNLGALKVPKGLIISNKELELRGHHVTAGVRFDI